MIPIFTDMAAFLLSGLSSLSPQIIDRITPLHNYVLIFATTKL